MSAPQKSARPRQPKLRDFDIYRLAVVRQWSQTRVAQAFAITPARVCQVLSRVRAWVDWHVGGWLFPERHDLRFYAALDRHHLRVREGDHPEIVVIEDYCGFPGYETSFEFGTQPSQADGDASAKVGAPLQAGASPHMTPQSTLQSGRQLPPQPLNPLEQAEAAIKFPSPSEYDACLTCPQHERHERITQLLRKIKNVHELHRQRKARLAAEFAV